MSIGQQKPIEISHVLPPVVVYAGKIHTHSEQRERDAPNAAGEFQHAAFPLPKLVQPKGDIEVHADITVVEICDGIERDGLGHYCSPKTATDGRAWEALRTVFIVGRLMRSQLGHFLTGARIDIF